MHPSPRRVFGLCLSLQGCTGHWQSIEWETVAVGDDGTAAPAKSQQIPKAAGHRCPKRASVNCISQNGRLAPTPTEEDTDQHRGPAMHSGGGVTYRMGRRESRHPKHCTGSTQHLRCVSLELTGAGKAYSKLLHEDPWGQVFPTQNKEDP